MTDKTYNVLFLCTGNSARSILAESILNKEGAGRFRAFSAGSQPKGEVNPHALKELETRGYPSTGLSSKSWDVFADPEHLRWISSSPSVTAPLAKPARYGSVTR